MVSLIIYELPKGSNGNDVAGRTLVSRGVRVDDTREDALAVILTLPLSSLLVLGLVLVCDKLDDIGRAIEIDEVAIGALYIPGPPIQ